MPERLGRSCKRPDCLAALRQETHGSKMAFLDGSPPERCGRWLLHDRAWERGLRMRAGSSHSMQAVRGQNTVMQAAVQGPEARHPGILGWALRRTPARCMGAAIFRSGHPTLTYPTMRRRLCAPMEEYIRGKGGEVRTGVRLQRIELDGCGSVAGFRLSDGSLATADLYVSAMPGAAACRGVVLAGPSRQGQGHLARVCEGRQANDVISTR